MPLAAAEVTGLFVTLEGGDGAGKTTQAARLAARLSALGHDVLSTREPGGSPGAEAIRGLVLDRDLKLSLHSEILLMFAARFDHVETIIRPALESGRIVLCDRFSDSTLAYQGYGLGQGAVQIIEMIHRLDSFLGVHPALTLILDVPEPDRDTRLHARGQAQDRYERLDTGFQQRVADGFRTIAQQSPERCRLVRGDGPVDLVEQRLFAALEPALA